MFISDTEHLSLAHSLCGEGVVTCQLEVSSPIIVSAPDKLYTLQCKFQVGRCQEVTTMGLLFNAPLSNDGQKCYGSNSIPISRPLIIKWERGWDEKYPAVCPSDLPLFITST